MTTSPATLDSARPRECMHCSDLIHPYDPIGRTKYGSICHPGCVTAANEEFDRSELSRQVLLEGNRARWRALAPDPKLHEQVADLVEKMCRRTPAAK